MFNNLTPAEYEVLLRHDFTTFAGRCFQDRREAELAIARYIDGFYNPVRRHSALSFTSPAQFEKLAAD